MANGNGALLSPRNSFGASREYAWPDFTQPLVRKVATLPVATYEGVSWPVRSPPRLSSPRHVGSGAALRRGPRSAPVRDPARVGDALLHPTRVSSILCPVLRPAGISTAAKWSDTWFQGLWCSNRMALGRACSTLVICLSFRPARFTATRIEASQQRACLSPTSSTRARPLRRRSDSRIDRQWGRPLVIHRAPVLFDAFQRAGSKAARASIGWTPSGSGGRHDRRSRDGAVFQNGTFAAPMR